MGHVHADLMLHKKWLDNEAGGKRADLSRADLLGADLNGADLRGADLSGAQFGLQFNEWS